MYSSISKCNVKSCVCCQHLCTKTTITSSVNDRTFSVINNSDLDWKSENLIHVLTWNTQYCHMQYVGQTCHKLKKRFGEYYPKIKTPKKIVTLLYQHFNRTGHSPDNVLVEQLSYDENSSVRFNTSKRFETELKWIKLLQSASPLGFNDNIYHEGNISKMPDFNVFSLLEIRKKGNVKRKIYAALPLITFQQS